MTPSETKDLVRLLLALCPAKAPPVTRDLARAWVEALEPYDYAAVKAAALEHARRKPFFPAVSDLIRAVPIPDHAAARNDLALAEQLLRQHLQKPSPRG